MTGWTWKTGAPRERAQTVRGHVSACLGNREKLKELFNLTEHGLSSILGGYDWRPEYSADSDGEPERAVPEKSNHAYPVDTYTA